MASQEIKRQFTLGKMEKDKDDRLVEPGAYRDASNVDVSRSEGDDSGALQVVRGNVLVGDQVYDADSTDVAANLVKPFGETVGVYPYPQEEKVYFFNTGRRSQEKETCDDIDSSTCIQENPEDVTGIRYRYEGEPYSDPCDPTQPGYVCLPAFVHSNMNAIYEYDQVKDVVSPVIIETDRGNYEAGGSGVQDFIGELFNTQIWSKAEYDKDYEPDDNIYNYNVVTSDDGDNTAFIPLTCSTETIVERDSDLNIVYRIAGQCSAPVCNYESDNEGTYAMNIESFVFNRDNPAPPANPANPPDDYRNGTFVFTLTEDVTTHGIEIGDTFQLTGLAENLIDRDFTITAISANGMEVSARDVLILDPVYVSGSQLVADVNCQSVTQFFWYDNEANDFKCTTDGTLTGTACTCGDSGCSYVNLPCGSSEVGRVRDDSECVSQPGAIGNYINDEEYDNLILEEEGGTEIPKANWALSAAPDTTIIYQTITAEDLASDISCTPDPGRSPADYEGGTRYTLNGNGQSLQPDQFCNPLCTIFNPDGCTPTEDNNYCYPDYCLPAPELDNQYNTKLTSTAIAHNRNRILTLEDYTTEESITVVLKRLVPETDNLTIDGAPVDGKYKFLPLDDNGRGIKTADNALVIRNMDALDFQQLDQIFGNVGWGSRPAGYTSRVRDSGNVSWVPNTDSTFVAIPNMATEAILGATPNPNNALITPMGQEGESLVFNVNTDRQQSFEVETEDQSDNVHDPDSPNYIDDNTRPEQ